MIIEKFHTRKGEELLEKNVVIKNLNFGIKKLKLDTKNSIACTFTLNEFCDKIYNLIWEIYHLKIPFVGVYEYDDANRGFHFHFLTYQKNKQYLKTYAQKNKHLRIHTEYALSNEFYKKYIAKQPFGVYFNNQSKKRNKYLRLEDVKKEIYGDIENHQLNISNLIYFKLKTHKINQDLEGLKTYINQINTTNIGLIQRNVRGKNPSGYYYRFAVSKENEDLVNDLQTKFLSDFSIEKKQYNSFSDWVNNSRTIVQKHLHKTLTIDDLFNFNDKQSNIQCNKNKENNRQSTNKRHTKQSKAFTNLVSTVKIKQNERNNQVQPESMHWKKDWAINYKIRFVRPP